MTRLTMALLGLVAYVYVGYPVAVAGAARLRRAPDRSTATGPAPTVSVVVAALDEEAVIGAKVRNLLGMDYPADRLDVVVVTDGSRDRTAERAAAVGDRRVTVLAGPVRQGKVAAMNRGVAASTGEIVVFTDANNSCPPGALGMLVAPFADPTVGAVSGAKTVEDQAGESGGERLYWAYESLIKESESRLGFCCTAIGELVAVRRALVPHFPERLVNDDFYLTMHVARAGSRMVYEPRAVSVEPPASEHDEVVRRRRIAAGRWQSLLWWRDTLPLTRPVVLWEVVSHKHLRLVLPFAMAGSLVAAAAGTARGSRAARGLLAAQVGAYALAGAAPYVRGPRPLRAAASAARYVASSNLAVALGLVDVVRGRDRLHLWQRAERPVLDLEDAA